MSAIFSTQHAKAVSLLQSVKFGHLLRMAIISRDICKKSSKFGIMLCRTTRCVIKGWFLLWGTIFFLIGTGISIYLIISKLTNPTGFSLTNRPGFYFALVALILGMQLFLAGFIGELISRNSPNRNSYLVETKTGL